MKTLCSVLVLLASVLLAKGAPIDGGITNQTVISNQVPARVLGESGANHRIWYKVAATANALGQTITTTNKAYEELATGLNYFDSETGQWKESKEEITASPGGAIANQGQHQVSFANNPNTAVAVDMQMNGQHLQSHVVGLSYLDTASGSNVWIAVIKNSQGVILPPNQVLYSNAFTGFKADVLYTYTKRGFEQDIVLRQRPPMPETFGLDPASTWMQVFTEFLSPPSPDVRTITIPSKDEGSLTDQLLDFGTLRIGSGRAFALGSDQLEGVPVTKEWVTLEGRTFLVEEVQVAQIASQLDALPLQAGVGSGANSNRRTASARRAMPAPKLAQTLSTNKMQLAKMSDTTGFVLDYVTLNTSQTNKTFQGDTTYYFSGNVSLYGTNNVFEGGAVLKYASNVTLTVNSPVTWLGTPYRPVVMVSKNDNSMGDAVSGSTGSPTNYFAATALYFDATTANTNLVLQNLRVANAKTAVAINGKGGHVLSHVQLINCGNGIAATNTDFSLRNALFYNVQTNFTGSTATGRVEQLTSDIANWLNKDIGTELYLTNCLLVAVTNKGSYTPQSVSIESTGSGVFTNVGSGFHYLVVGSTNRDVGTPSINSTLLAELRKMTTYPPVIVSNATFSTSTNFNPQATRDTDTLDLGYHYDPLDYLMSAISVTTSATLSLSNGVAIGMIGTSGFTLHSSGKLVSAGTAANLNHLAGPGTVQEQSPLSAAGFISSDGSAGDNPSVRLRFTELTTLTTTAYIFGSYVPFDRIELVNCVVRSISDSWVPVTGDPSWLVTIALTNNVFERGYLSFWKYYDAHDTKLSVCLRNNLFWRSTVDIFYSESIDYPESNLPWDVKDNAFDNTSLSFYELYEEEPHVTTANNGYVNTTAIGGSGDVSVSTFNYASGSLGRWYQSSTNFINKGSTTADLVGLYHFTTQTNQTKETNSTVDIGYHYVAVDAYGSPIDTDGDGIPDYLEDANGNGVVDGSETSWILNNYNGLSFGNGLQVFTPLK